MRSNKPKSPHQWIVEPVTGCWIWQRATTGGGYGIVVVKGRRMTATRYVYEKIIGPIPKGFVLDHVKERCTNTLCVNPEHLEPVTTGENIARGKNGKLSKDAIKSIIRSQSRSRDLAEKHGVSKAHINMIRAGTRGQWARS